MRTSSWSLVVLVTATLALAACGGSSVKQGSGGAPDAVVSPDTEPTPGAVLRTRLATEEVPACFETSAICELVRADGSTVIVSNTSLIVSPAEGVRVEDHVLIAEQPGSYTVACASNTTDRVDEDPPTLTVVAASPALVRTTLDPATVEAGQPSTVICEVEDACGELLSDETVVRADEGVVVDGHTVTAALAGSYAVWCEPAGPTKFPVEGDPATLTVLEPRPVPVRIELNARPDKRFYLIGDVVRVTGTAYDENGDVVPDAEIEIQVPEGMGVFNASSQRFESEGTFVYTGFLVEDPSITDELALVCDNGPPQLIIFSPERGDTFDEPDARIPVSGQVIDGGGVDYLRVNGEDIAFDAEGYFSTTWLSDYGLNVLWFEARDGYGNELRTSRAYYYSTDWIPMDPPDMEVARRLDAVQLFLGQDILDDGDHDPAHVDDLATVIELLLSAIDIEGLIGGGNMPMSLVDQVFPDIVDYSFSVLGIDFGLRGDLSLKVEILDIIVGGWRVSALYRDGGIDLSLGIAGDSPEQPGIGLVLGVTLAFDLSLGAFLPGAGFVGIDFAPPPAVMTTSAAYASGIHFRIGVDADMPTGGDLSVAISELRLDIDDVDIELLESLIIDLGTVNVPVVGAIDLPEFELTNLVAGLDDLVTDAVIDPLLNWLLDGLGDLVSPLLSQALTLLVEQLVDLLAIDLDLPLPQLPGAAAAVTLHLSLQPSSVHMDPVGGVFGLGAGLTADKFVDRDPHGSILRDGCMGQDPAQMQFAPEPPMQVGFLFDFVNEAIFALWWGGGINLELDLGELLGGGGMGGISADAVIGLDFLLPPILTDCTQDGLTELQIGDLYLELDGDIMGFISGGLKTWVDVRMQAEIVASGSTIGLRVTRDPEITLDIEEMTGALGMFEGLILDLLENQLIPMIVDGINGALSSIPIPEIDLGALLPGAPAGAVLRLGNLEAFTGQGYFTVGGDLVP